MFLVIENLHNILGVFGFAGNIREWHFHVLVVPKLHLHFVRFAVQVEILVIVIKAEL